MGRSPCSSKERAGLNRGAWTAQEDRILRDYIAIHGVDGGWEKLSKQAAGLTRSGRSCRLRWLNYLHPDVIHGNISPYEEDLIVRLHGLLGNRWSLIAGRLPGRTDNEIKNYWKTHLSRKRFRVNKESSSNKKSVLLEQNPREIFHCKRTSACPNYNSPELHVQNHVFKPLALRPMVDINLFETEVQNVSTSRSMSSLTEQKSPGPHDHAAEAATVADSFLDLSELYCHFLSSPSDSSTYLIGLEDFCSTILAADNIHEFEDIMGSVQSNMQHSTILQ